MRSVILSSGTRAVMPAMLIVSLFMLLRGHNEPGGGFIGGLIAASALALYNLAFGHEELRRTLKVDPHLISGGGLLMSLASTFVAPLVGKPPLTGVWVTIPLPLTDGVKLGTPLLFDAGVYFVVIGIISTIVLSLSEAEADEEVEPSSS